MSENADKITEALEKLKNTSMEIGKAIYSQSSSEGDSTESEQKTEEKPYEEKKDENKDEKK